MSADHGHTSAILAGQSGRTVVSFVVPVRLLLLKTVLVVTRVLVGIILNHYVWKWQSR